MQAIYDDIKQMNGEIIVFSAENAELSADLARKHKLTFPIVQDAGLNISRALGIAFMLPDELKGVYQSFGFDLPKNTGHDAWELPMPARFVLDKDGVIRAVDADPDYTKRPEADATLAFARSL